MLTIICYIFLLCVLCVLCGKYLKMIGYHVGKKLPQRTPATDKVIYNESLFIPSFIVLNRNSESVLFSIRWL